MRTYLIIVLVIGIGLVPLATEAYDVLLLGDGGSETQVQTALETAGNVVTYAGVYDTWDGVTPSATDFDVVVFLDGHYPPEALQTAAADALMDFVETGHGLVITEWSAWDVCEGYKGDVIGNLLPVTMSFCSWVYGDTWTVTDPNHPLTANMPAPWYDDAGLSRVDLKPDSIAVVTGARGYPMVTYSHTYSGIVVHLNHDMTYTTATINGNALQLIVNAVDFAGPVLLADSFECGSCSGWSSMVP